MKRRKASPARVATEPALVARAGKVVLAIAVCVRENCGDVQLSGIDEEGETAAEDQP